MLSCSSRSYAGKDGDRGGCGEAGGDDRGEEERGRGASTVDSGNGGSIGEGGEEMAAGEGRYDEGGG